MLLKNSHKNQFASALKGALKWVLENTNVDGNVRTFNGSLSVSHAEQIARLISEGYGDVDTMTLRLSWVKPGEVHNVEGKLRSDYNHAEMRFYLDLTWSKTIA